MDFGIDLTQVEISGKNIFVIGIFLSLIIVGLIKKIAFVVPPIKKENNPRTYWGIMILFVAIIIMEIHSIIVLQ